MAEETVRDPAGHLHHPGVHPGREQRNVDAHRRGHLRGRRDVHVVETAVMAHRPLVQPPQPAQQRQQFLHPGRGPGRVDAVPAGHHLRRAGAEPVDEPAPGQLVQAAGLGREHERGAADRVRDRAADPRAGRGLGHGGQADDRGPGVELGAPGRVVAESFGFGGGGGGVGDAAAQDREAAGGGAAGAVLAGAAPAGAVPSGAVMRSSRGAWRRTRRALRGRPVSPADP